MNILDFTTFTVAQLEEAFKTSAASGLRTEQIAALKKQYGPNALEEHETTWATFVKLFLSLHKRMRMEV